MADRVAVRRRVARARLTAASSPTCAPPTSASLGPIDTSLGATEARADSAPAALAELVRTIGLTGLVRPASQPAIGAALAIHTTADNRTGQAGACGEAAALGTAVGRAQFLPVIPALSHLLPGGGLRRGTTVAVCTRTAGAPSPGATSLLLALLAAASRAGSWCAVVGVPTLGMVAAAELGIDLDRLALVPNPGPQWPAVVAALVDGMDIVVTALPGSVAAGLANRLAARARQRGSVLVPYGEGWPGADVTLTAVRSQWHGLGQGRGRLRGRRLTVTARGRGAAARPKQAHIWLPAAAGTTHRGRGPLTLLPGGAQSAALDEAV